MQAAIWPRGVPQFSLVLENCSNILESMALAYFLGISLTKVHLLTTKQGPVFTSFSTYPGEKVLTVFPKTAHPLVT